MSYSSLILFITYISLSFNVYAFTVPKEFLLIRTYPSIFKIFNYEDLEFTCPTKFELRKNVNGVTVLASDYQKDLDSGAVDVNISKPDYLWGKIAENPGNYIEASNYEKSIIDTSSSGTGFVISREGVLLTNAHVVSNPAIIPEDIVNIYYNSIDQSIFNEIMFDMPNSKPLADKYIKNIATWFNNKCNIVNKKRGTYLLLDYLAENNNTTDKPPKDMSQLLIPIEILSIGENWGIGGSKDVAVVKIADNFQYKCSGGETITLNSSDFYDKFVSIRLGDSDDLIEGTEIVTTFGFPAGRFFKRYMTHKADLRAISDDGKIRAFLESSGGWKFIESDAIINKGDSGGPLVNSSGEVIGINVAKSPIIEKSNYYIPINIAKEFLREANIKPDPGPLTSLWEKGLYEYSNGQYDSSELTLFELKRKQLGDLHSVTTAPVSCRIHWVNPYVKDIYNKSYSKARKGEEDTLTTDFNKFMLNAGNYADEGNFDKAITEYTKAINLKPDYAYAYHARGVSYAQNQNYVYAIWDFTKSLRLDPESDNAKLNYSNRAGAYYGINYLNSAIDSSNKAIEIDEYYGTPYVLRAHSHFAKYRYEKAIDDYKYAKNLDPRASYFQDDFANALRKKDDNEAKILDFTLNLMSEPNNSQLHYNRCKYLLRYGTEEKIKIAIKDCTRAIELNPGYVEAYNNRGIGFFELGNFVKAETDFKKVLDIDPEYASAYVGLGEVYIKTARYKDAKVSFNKALAIDPNMIEAEDNLELLNNLLNERDIKNNSSNENIEDLFQDIDSFLVN